MSDKPMGAFSFKFMYFILKFRDAFLRPRKILNKIEGIRNGVSILDYGCGPGSFTMVAAEMVGKDGTVIAADIHPLAIKQIQKSASKKGFKNIKTILTDGNTGLPDSSIDIILLYYVLHDFHNPYGIIRELYRVLKSDGILTVIDHKLRDEEVNALLTKSSSAFEFRNKINGKILVFVKTTANQG
ncbi:MAG: class I SAM-dependent methyltransferase [Nitrososphaeraceae archaeon]